VISRVAGIDQLEIRVPSSVPLEEDVEPSPNVVEPATAPVEEEAPAIPGPEPKADSNPSESVDAVPPIKDVKIVVSHGTKFPPSFPILIHPHFRLIPARTSQFPQKVCCSCVRLKRLLMVCRECGRGP
jgi:hypothetical protein